jgi:hypothetical protein
MRHSKGDGAHCPCATRRAAFKDLILASLYLVMRICSVAGAVAGAEGDSAASLVFTYASAAAAPRPTSFAGGSLTKTASQTA